MSSGSPSFTQNQLYRYSSSYNRSTQLSPPEPFQSASLSDISIAHSGDVSAPSLVMNEKLKESIESLDCSTLSSSSPSRRSRYQQVKGLYRRSSIDRDNNSTQDTSATSSQLTKMESLRNTNAESQHSPSSETESLHEDVVPSERVSPSVSHSTSSSSSVSNQTHHHDNYGNHRHVGFVSSTTAASIEFHNKSDDDGFEECGDIQMSTTDDTTNNEDDLENRDPTNHQSSKMKHTTLCADNNSNGDNTNQMNVVEHNQGIEQHRKRQLDRSLSMGLTTGRNRKTRIPRNSCEWIDTCDDEDMEHDGSEPIANNAIVVRQSVDYQSHPLQSQSSASHSLFHSPLDRIGNQFSTQQSEHVHLDNDDNRGDPMHDVMADTVSRDVCGGQEGDSTDDENRWSMNVGRVDVAHPSENGGGHNNCCRDQRIYNNEQTTPAVAETVLDDEMPDMQLPSDQHHLQTRQSSRFINDDADNDDQRSMAQLETLEDAAAAAEELLGTFVNIQQRQDSELLTANSFLRFLNLRYLQRRLENQQSDDNNSRHTTISMPNDSSRAPSRAIRNSNSHEERSWVEDSSDIVEDSSTIQQVESDAWRLYALLQLGSQSRSQFDLGRSSAPSTIASPSSEEPSITSSSLLLSQLPPNININHHHNATTLIHPTNPSSHHPTSGILTPEEQIDSSTRELTVILKTLKVDDKILSKVDHSAKFVDDVYEYRFVILPRHHPYFDLDLEDELREGLMKDTEWRLLGIRQTRGWEHYGYSRHESNIFLFRRALGTDPRSGKVATSQRIKVEKRKQLIERLKKEFEDSRRSMSQFSSGPTTFSRRQENKENLQKTVERLPREESVDNSTLLSSSNVSTPIIATVPAFGSLQGGLGSSSSSGSVPTYGFIDHSSLINPYNATQQQLLNGGNNVADACRKISNSINARHLAAVMRTGDVLPQPSGPFFDLPDSDDGDECEQLRRDSLLDSGKRVIDRTEDSENEEEVEGMGKRRKICTMTKECFINDIDWLYASLHMPLYASS